MFKKVAPYIGKNKKYTIAAVILMSIGIIANVVPYFFLYQIIAPLIRGESIDTGFILVRVITVAVVILDEATASVDADKILVISDGQVKEEGNHTDIMEKDGTYAHMVKLQSA